jgi:AraC family transcriptional regulator
MDIAGEILRLVDYIEDNLAEKPTLDDLAGEAFVSKYHLHRVFKAAAGQTAHGYMLSRRLAKSLPLLTGTSLRTSDIAAELGFYDHSAFSHAFRKEYGISPTQYRKSPSELPVRGRLCATDLRGAGDALIAWPAFVSLPAFTATGLPCKVYYMDNIRYNKANLAGMDFFENRARGVPCAVNPDVYIGLTLFPEDDDRFTWYIPSAEVLEGSPVPPGMVQHRIPAQDYAVFHYVGFHRRDQITEKMIPLFQHVFYDWMPKSRYRPRSMFFERIDQRNCAEEYYEVDLCCSLAEAGREDGT